MREVVAENAKSFQATKSRSACRQLDATMATQLPAPETRKGKKKLCTVCPASVPARRYRYSAVCLESKTYQMRWPIPTGTAELRSAAQRERSSSSTATLQQLKQLKQTRIGRILGICKTAACSLLQMDRSSIAST